MTTATKALSSSVEEARAKVKALARAEVDRYRQLAPKRKELFEAQQAKNFKKAAELREEVEYLQDDESGRKERREAIIALHLLQAQELEGKAAALRVEIEEREVKAKSLLAQLEDFENVELRHKHIDDRSVTRGLATDADSMALQARGLRRLVEHGEVKTTGRLSGYNVEELIEGLMRIPEVIGPSIAAIYEEVATRKIRPNTRGEHLELVFYGSRIDEFGWDGRPAGQRRKSGVVI